MEQIYQGALVRWLVVAGILCAGLAAGYFYGAAQGMTGAFDEGVKKGVVDGVLQERARVDAQKKEAAIKAAAAANPFGQAAANPYAGASVNPFTNVKVNPFK